MIRLQVNGMKIRFPQVCLVSLILAAAGCTAGGPSVGRVSGKVRYKDEVLTSGAITWTVVFVGRDGDTTAGLVGASGEYTAESVPTGLAKIAVVGSPRVPTGLRNHNEQLSVLAEEDSRLLKSLVKFKDPDKSGLTYMVNKGKQGHDIELE